MIPEGKRDALSLVGYTDLEELTVFFSMNFYFGIRICEFRSIGEQVCHDLLKPSGIHFPIQRPVIFI